MNLLARLRAAHPLRYVALHEAGHAVAALLLGLPVREARIGWAGGRVDVRWRDHARQDRLELEDQIVCYLAGAVVATFQQNGTPGGFQALVRDSLRAGGYTEDARNVLRFVERLDMLPVEQEAFLDWLAVRAYVLLVPHPAAVLAVAEALLKRRRLSEGEIRDRMSEPKRRRR